MKLAVIGGGGVRAPKLAKSLALGLESTGISEVVFMDINAQKLNTYGLLAKLLFEKLNSSVHFSLTTDAKIALENANYIITTIRPGEDEGRAFDERTCVDNGVLGQETTGAGGFAMALRSIPAIKNYCMLAGEFASPGHVIFNFTNPSGLVTQAMRDLGYSNVFGVCDAPSGFFNQVSDMLGIKRGHVFARCFGLNHLSWFDKFTLNDQDITETVLRHSGLYEKTDAKLFGVELVSLLNNKLPNEYLYFYYSRAKALSSLKGAEKTRGETIAEINAGMNAELQKINIEADLGGAFDIYSKYSLMRENSYFSIETGERQRFFETQRLEAFLAEPDDGGYAAVALDYIRAINTKKEGQMVLSVSNNGAIKGMEETDVVEVSCIINENGVTPVPADDVPAECLELMRSVKLYERLAVDAILRERIDLATKALMIHPLIGDYSAADKLAEAFWKQYYSVR